MTYKGLNWGTLNIHDDHLLLNSAGTGHPIFNLDFKNITNSTVNKNDITIETAADDLDNDDCMCEIRFYVEEPK